MGVSYYESGLGAKAKFGECPRPRPANDRNDALASLVGLLVEWLDQNEAGVTGSRVVISPFQRRVTLYVGNRIFARRYHHPRTRDTILVLVAPVC